MAIRVENLKKITNLKASKQAKSTSASAKTETFSSAELIDILTSPKFEVNTYYHEQNVFRVIGYSILFLRTQQFAIDQSEKYLRQIQNLTNQYLTSSQNEYTNIDKQFIMLKNQLSQILDIKFNDQKIFSDSQLSLNSLVYIANHKLSITTANLNEAIVDIIKTESITSKIEKTQENSTKELIFNLDNALSKISMIKKNNADEQFTFNNLSNQLLATDNLKILKKKKKNKLAKEARLLLEQINPEVKSLIEVANLTKEAIKELNKIIKQKPQESYYAQANSEHTKVLSLIYKKTKKTPTDGDIY
jgi:hypothetical protein